jgi:TPR repeat protein
MILLAFCLCSLAFPACAQSTQPATSTASLDRRATILYQQKRFAEAFPLYLKAATRGDVNAQLSVADMYFWGKGVTQDFAKGMSWCQKAADRGDARAEMKLAGLYGASENPAHDPAQALLWAQKAAMTGDMQAEDMLAGWYLGIVPGIASDYQSAMLWFKKAAAQGSGHSMVEIAWMYQEGLGGQQDTAQARAWYHKAIVAGCPNAGCPNAKRQLARMDAAATASTQQRQSAPAAAPSSYQAAQYPTGQGTCAVVWEAITSDAQAGTHKLFGAAWSRSTLEDAKAAARTEIGNHINGASIFRLTDSNAEAFGDGMIQPLASGCGNPHGAVVAKLKKYNGQMLGNGIYDVIAANLAGTTNEAISNATARCQQIGGGGDTNEVCTVIVQW